MRDRLAISYIYAISMRRVNPLLHTNFFSLPLKYHVFENIMENGAFALLEQMLHFLLYVQKYSKLYFIFP